MSTDYWTGIVDQRGIMFEKYECDNGHTSKLPYGSRRVYCEICFIDFVTRRFPMRKVLTMESNPPVEPEVPPAPPAEEPAPPPPAEAPPAEEKPAEEAPST